MNAGSIVFFLGDALLYVQPVQRSRVACYAAGIVGFVDHVQVKELVKAAVASDGCQKCFEHDDDVFVMVCAVDLYPVVLMLGFDPQQVNRRVDGGFGSPVFHFCFSCRAIYFWMRDDWRPIVSAK